MTILKKNLLSLVLGALFIFAGANVSMAAENKEDQKVSAEILNVLNEQTETIDGEDVLTQILEVKIQEGPLKNKKIQVENKNNYAAGLRKYQSGDQVFLATKLDENSRKFFQVYDYNRLSPLFWLFLLFVGVTLMIGRMQGLLSFIGMILSFAVIFYLLLPQILAGQDAFLMAILTALIIVPVTFYLAHGKSHKTLAAMAGTMITLGIVCVITYWAIRWTHLTGADSEEVNILMQDGQGSFDFRQLLLAGIIISLLGILDDITISQAAIVYKLKEVSPNLKWQDLFVKSMDVGRDHIASVVNTLVLVYAGAALPLLMVFLKNPAPVTEIINEGFMSEEIVTTLVSSLGIVIAVPLTTLVAAFMVYHFQEKKLVQKKSVSSKQEIGHHHH